MSNLPDLGQDVTIEVLTEAIQTLLAEDEQEAPRDSGPSLESATAKVVAVTPKTLTLALRPASGPARAFTSGTKLVLHYHDDNGLYLMLAKVIQSDAAAGTFTVQTQGLMGHQRRRHPRIAAALNVRYQVAAAAGTGGSVGNWQPARARDISHGGLLLEVAGQLAPGTAILLAVELPAGTIHVQGRVTRTRPGSGDKILAGVRFTEITPEDQATLDDFIAASVHSA